MQEIPGLRGYYATAAGTIVSTRSGEARILKQWDQKGYLTVTVTVLVNGKRDRRPMQVHRLVLLAFKGPAPDGMEQGRHLSGDPSDNRSDNLAWGTHKDNAQDAIRHGTLGPGERAHRRKLTEAQVKTIRTRLAGGERSTDLAREFGVSPYYPKQLAAGRNWGHVS